MKIILRILCVVFLAAVCQPAEAQSRKKGFDYRHHQKMNKKAKRWGEHRVRASDGDLVNVKCDARSSRRYARRQRS